MLLFGRPAVSTLRYAPSKAPRLNDLEIVAEPDLLRRLAAFFEQTATQMEAPDMHFDHVHLLDAWDAHGTGIPDIVISRDNPSIPVNR